jgi:glycosyltransferase involved in cell wall biosynthesis
MLVVLTSHPIQYQAPLWRALADYRTTGLQDDGQGGGVPFEVWFLTDQGVRRTEDRDFGQAFAWDVDLLSGYPHKFLELRGKWDMQKFDGIPLAKPIGESLREANATALWIEGWRFKPFWDAVSVAKKMGIAVFLRGETSDKIAEKGGLFGMARNFALHRLFAKVDHFLTIGQASRRFYLRHGVPEGKLVDAPYGVDNEFFRAEAGKIRGARQEARGEGEEQPHAADQKTKRPRDESEKTDFDILTERQREIRREWNMPLDAKVVMFCGKFVGKKRPLDVVEAVGILAGKADKLKSGKAETKRHHLLFVGSGELGDELRAACDVVYDEEEGVAARLAKVTAGRRQESGEAGGGSNDASGAMLHAPCSMPPATFAGFLNQSEISRAYAVADVVVLPSEAWETWGLVVNEATAAGVPTVVSDRCGCSDDFATRNPYTRVFPMGNVAAMARAIEEVLALKAEPDEVTKFAEAFAPRITAEAVAERLKAAD